MKTKLCCIVRPYFSCLFCKDKLCASCYKEAFYNVKTGVYRNGIWFDTHLCHRCGKQYVDIYNSMTKIFIPINDRFYPSQR